MWSEGDVICVRQTWLGRVWQAHAWYVVADGEDELVLFAPIGAEAWFSGIPIPRDEWTLKQSAFKEHLLLLARPGVGYSTSLIWDASWTLREWYVNFERPVRPRSPVGFDYVDVALDLVCTRTAAGSCSTRTSSRRGWSAACSPRRTRPQPAPMPSVSSPSGRSRPAGRTGVPIPAGSPRVSQRGGTQWARPSSRLAARFEPHARKPLEPARHVPVPAAEQLHRAR